MPIIANAVEMTAIIGNVTPQDIVMANGVEVFSAQFSATMVAGVDASTNSTGFKEGLAGTLTPKIFDGYPINWCTNTFRAPIYYPFVLRLLQTAVPVEVIHTIEIVEKSLILTTTDPIFSYLSGFDYSEWKWDDDTWEAPIFSDGESVTIKIN